MLRLGGALRAPLSTLSDDELAEYDQFEQWAAPYPHAFQSALAALVNLAADYTEPGRRRRQRRRPACRGRRGRRGPDHRAAALRPLARPGVAARPRPTPIPSTRRWVDELNLDPRHRVAAGLGTGVVQKNQEAYMEAAWQQVGKVLEGNARIRFGQMAMLDLEGLAPPRARPLAAAGSGERLLGVTAPVHRGWSADGTTVAYAVQAEHGPAGAGRHDGAQGAATSGAGARGSARGPGVSRSTT